MITLFDKIGISLKKYQQILWLLIFLQSLVGMLGSWYYSTFGDPVTNFAKFDFFPSGSGLPPCELCWYARILMYPMVLISGIAIMKKEKHFTDYILPLAVIGVLLELYHYSLQKFPIVVLTKCSEAVPCNAIQTQYFGFITIPLLGLVAFIFITLLSVGNILINRVSQKKQSIQN